MDSETKPAVFRSLAVVVSVAVVFVTIEIIGSIALSSATRDPEVPQELAASLRLKNRKTKTIPDPYLTYRVAPSIDWDHIRTNRYGLRNGPIEARPSPDTFRVLFLGGSVAWGSTSRSNDQTPAAFLERYLTEQRDQVPALRGKRIEVLNGGVPAYVAWQSALSYTINHRALENLSDITRVEGALALPVLQPMVVLPDPKPLTSFEWL